MNDLMILFEGDMDAILDYLAREEGQHEETVSTASGFGDVGADVERL